MVEVSCPAVGVALLAVATQALALTDALFRPAGELTHLALFALAGVVGVFALRNGAEPAGDTLER